MVGEVFDSTEVLWFVLLKRSAGISAVVQWCSLSWSWRSLVSSCLTESNTELKASIEAW